MSLFSLFLNKALDASFNLQNGHCKGTFIRLPLGDLSLMSILELNELGGVFFTIMFTNTIKEATSITAHLFTGITIGLLLGTGIGQSLTYLISL